MANGPADEGLAFDPDCAIARTCSEAVYFESQACASERGDFSDGVSALPQTSGTAGRGGTKGPHALEGSKRGRVKVTEKVFYAPRIRERQRRAEADARRTWSRDRVGLMQNKTDLAGTNDTQTIHERLGRAN